MVIEEHRKVRGFFFGGGGGWLNASVVGIAHEMVSGVIT